MNDSYMKNNKVKVIHNGGNTDIFRPASNLKNREKF